ncbi:MULTISPECIES: tripartite tricarboxylate transporter substrate binding protein [unclassified Polynucleobacter]|uniref:tripartite tricarboxylate transporter substrate binding protein n=1 Tax=unclassified Polynucleobacter TaxID=2640945 RepID=UPI0021074EC4|nr:MULTISPECIES: tripartite tricarboxylate transporter substrate binding protein [unclassified Polynucleobacter]MEA9567415.1 tripartite tricarboxylate transporter substrate binding protein [Polynucleobacter sp. AP-Nickl1-40-C4]
MRLKTVAYCLALVVGMFGFTSSQLFAQGSAAYPEKPITIIVPYPPGGFNDTLGRIVGKKLSDAWGVNVIIENKPGAGTTIGTNFVARSAPDGYTILVAQFPFAANPFIYKSLPYDTSKAFSPVVLAGRAPMVLVVNENSKIKSLGDLLAAAKKSPGKIDYGSSGSGSSEHLAMALFENMANVSLNQIPYKGSTPLLTDLAGGQVEVAFDVFPMVRPFIQSGKIRPIAIATDMRSPLLPQVPTVTEAGLKGYEVSSWHGFMVPSGTPPVIIDKLNKQINSILTQEDIKKTFNEQGVVPDGGTANQFDVFIRKQMEIWKKVVAQAGIIPE